MPAPARVLMLMLLARVFLRVQLACAGSLAQPLSFLHIGGGLQPSRFIYGSCAEVVVDPGNNGTANEGVDEPVEGFHDHFTYAPGCVIAGIDRCHELKELRALAARDEICERHAEHGRSP